MMLSINILTDDLFIIDFSSNAFFFFFYLSQSSVSVVYKITQSANHGVWKLDYLVYWDALFNLIAWWYIVQVK